MRLLLAHPYTSWNGVRRGGERYLDDLLDLAVALGHDVTVATATTVGGGAYEVRGARVVELDVPQGRRDEGFGDAVGALLEREAYDLVHAFELPPALAAAGAGTPVVLSVLGLPRAGWLAERPSYARDLREATHRVDVVCALSGAAAAAVQEATGVRPRVLPPGTRLERFPLSARSRDGRTVLFASALGEERKRFAALLEALEQVPQACLVVAGHGDPAPALARHPALAARTQVRQAAGSAELAALYRAAAVVAAPSVDEAFGLVVVEALASGTPVLVAPGSGPQEVVGGLDVGVVTDDLATGLRDLLARPRDPQACRARAEAYGWERLGPEHEALWGEAAQRSAGRAGPAGPAGAAPG